jgi:hypothetical protein
MIVNHGPMGQGWTDQQGRFHPYDETRGGLGRISNETVAAMQLAGLGQGSSGLGGYAMIGLLLGLVGVWAVWSLSQGQPSRPPPKYRLLAFDD